MKKVYIAAGIALLMLSATAAARVFTASERNSTVDLCRSMVSAGASARFERDLRGTGMNEEEINYVLDMCFAYVSGRLDEALST